MNHSTQNEFLNGSGGSAGTSEAEHTLRLIARLPVPAGLEDRVQAGVLQAGLRGRQMEGSRTGRVLTWPSLRPATGWMRTAAAAAIVFVVAGGGWGVYSRVQLPQAAKVIVMPPRVVSPGGFSNAGAMRTPTTLAGPIVANPAPSSKANPAQANTVQPNAAAPIGNKTARRTRAMTAAQSSGTQTTVPAQK